MPAVISEILRSRGITDQKDIEEFFSSKPQLAYDPFLLANMRAGVDLLLKAIDDHKRIVIYGDYDADGVTSTALLMKVIGYLTDDITYYIPSRLDEGYGLNRDAIDRIREGGGDVIVTVDCGIASEDETKYAHELGIETIVTDHHNVASTRAEGIVIDPKAPEDEYPFKGLAGVGVAYKFALAISRERKIPHSLLTEILELVTVGTVADIMPLVDENRTIVKYGLRLMRLGCMNIGLRKLIEFSGMDQSVLKASNIAFGIAPRINAAGRLGDASLGVKMLLADNEEDAGKYCGLLIDANTTRRTLQDEAYDKCISIAKDELDSGDFLLIEAEDVHEGILGIVAGKIKEELSRPVVIVTESADGYKGTGRSVPGVDLFGMLNKYRDSFTRFGGHSAACGFTMPKDNIDELRTALNRDMAEMKAADEDIFETDHNIDAFIEPEDADLELAEATEMFEPCGNGNEAITFAFRGVRPEGWRFLKNGTKYAKFRIGAGNGEMIDCLLFHDAEDMNRLCENEETVDVFGNLEINTWNNTRKVQMLVSGILPPGRITDK